MMRKSTLILIIVIAGLMLYTGCDDGGGGGQGRQGAGVQCPGDGVPPKECDLDRCPCDFYSVPMTEQCWGVFGRSPTFESSPVGGGAECSLFPVDAALTDGLAIFSGIVGPCERGGGERCCQIPAFDHRFPLECRVVTFNVLSLSFDQIAACKKCLGCYATDLNNKGINVSGGPPYICINQQAPVPQTGQTTCWDSDGNVIACTGTGQDGDIRAGVKWPKPRFTDNGEGQITDNLTGLVWLKNANCFGRRTWAQALEDANTLHTGECGLRDGSAEGDWRLPNRNELMSLLDLENFDPSLPTGHPFMNFAESSGYWSSTTAAFQPRSAWGVSVSAGGVGWNDKDRNELVTAVRNPKIEREAAAPVPQTGQTTCWDSDGNVIACTGTGQDGDILAGVKWPNPRFTDNKDGTVTDNLTGLVWLKDANCFGRLTWAQALTDANNLADGKCGLTDGSVAGDWYLPNPNQLMSLLDLENFSPALPTGHPFMNFQGFAYWSSTTVAFRPDSAWSVSVGGGYEIVAEKVTDSVTAVRGGL